MIGWRGKMSRICDENLVLSIEESRNLLESLFVPEEDVRARRRKFFESIDELQVERNSNGKVSIEIPNLQFDNINQKVDLFNAMDNGKYCFSEEAFIEVNYYDKKKMQISMDHVQYSSKASDVDIYYDVKGMNVVEAA